MICCVFFTIIFKSLFVQGAKSNVLKGFLAKTAASDVFVRTATLVTLQMVLATVNLDITDKHVS